MGHAIGQKRTEAIAGKHQDANVDFGAESLGEVKQIHGNHVAPTRNLHLHPEADTRAIDDLALFPIDPSGLSLHPTFYGRKAVIDHLPDNGSSICIFLFLDSELEAGDDAQKFLEERAKPKTIELNRHLAVTLR